MPAGSSRAGPSAPTSAPVSFGPGVAGAFRWSPESGEPELPSGPSWGGPGAARACERAAGPRAESFAPATSRCGSAAASSSWPRLDAADAPPRARALPQPALPQSPARDL
eukprot:8024911-Alexandrium_andersonii.AAC.1